MIVNSPHVPVNAIVVREIFYLKFVFNCSSTYSLTNELSLCYMKHYYIIWGWNKKDLLCLRGFERGRRQGANRKGDIGHLFGLANWKFFGKLYRIKGSLGKGRKGLGLTYFWIWFLMPLINLFFSLASLVNLIFCFKEYCLRKKKKPFFIFL